MENVQVTVMMQGSYASSVALILLIGHVVVAFYAHIACSNSFNREFNGNYESDKKEPKRANPHQLLEYFVATMSVPRGRDLKAIYCKRDKQEDPLQDLMKVYYYHNYSH